MTTRLPIRKTYKLFIGGQFPRSESGRSRPMTNPQGQLVANLSWASRKDLRDAVGVARKAQEPWAARTAFNRGQILYRMAEMLESRRQLFERGLVEIAGFSPDDAASDVNTAIDRLVWYAGWCDKFEQFYGTVNPVAAPFHNVSRAEGVGVAVVFAPSASPVAGLVSAFAPVIAGGNTAVVVVDNAAPSLAIELAEVLATSDLPGGVVNLLTSVRDELLPWAADHDDVDAIAVWGASPAQAVLVETRGAETIKRVRLYPDHPTAAFTAETTQSPWLIADTVEVKTAWHPIAH